MSVSPNSTRVIVCKNGESNGAELLVPDSIDDLLQRATEALRLPDKATRLFKYSGEEVTSCKDLQEGEFLFCSTGEEFVPVGASSILAHSSSFDDDDKEAIKPMEDGPIGFKELPPKFQEHLLHALDEGEEVKWSGRPVIWLTVVKNILFCLGILGFAGLMSGLIDEWRVLIYNFSCAIFATVMILLATSTTFHEFYAVTNRRIIILHTGCLCNVLWCKKSVKKSPLFSKLTNFQLDVERQFGLESVFFRGAKLGFTNLRDGKAAARAIKQRLPEAPPKTQIVF